MLTRNACIGPGFDAVNPSLWILAAYAKFSLIWGLNRQAYSSQEMTAGSAKGSITVSVAGGEAWMGEDELMRGDRSRGTHLQLHGSDSASRSANTDLVGPGVALCETQGAIDVLRTETG